MKYNWWQMALVQLTIVFVLFVLFFAAGAAFAAECGPNGMIELRKTETGITFCTERGCHPEYKKVGTWTYERWERNEFEERRYVVHVVDNVVNTYIYIDGKLAQTIPPMTCEGG